MILKNPALPILIFALLTLSACRGLTHNTAETQAAHADPTLRTRHYPHSEAVVFEKISGVIAELPRWQMIEKSQNSGIIVATRTSRLFRFVDDVTIRITETAPDAVTVDVHSASRVGKGDFGQNRRNIRELLKALDQKILN